jgi:hypothetical protein
MRASSRSSSASTSRNSARASNLRSVYRPTGVNGKGLKESVVVRLSRTRVGITLSLLAVGDTAGPGWHPFLNDATNQDGQSRPITLVASNGHLMVSVDLVRGGDLNPNLCWRSTPSGSRFAEWDHSLSAWWHFHHHFGLTGHDAIPASSDITLKLVVVAERAERQP